MNKPPLTDKEKEESEAFDQALNDLESEHETSTSGIVEKITLMNILKTNQKNKQQNVNT